MTLSSNLLLKNHVKVLAFTFLFSLISAFCLGQAGVKISQVYAGGGGSTGTYLRDYVELYNSSCSSVNIGGWSIAYGSATGNFGSSTSNVFTFPAGTTIGPKKYILIETGASGSAGAALPVTPDFQTATTGFSMSGTAGKVGLFNTVISNLPCSSLVASTVVDKVSYGTGNCPEGTVITGTISSTSALVRNNGGETDTDNNSADFTITATSSSLPRNSSSSANTFSPCTFNLSITNSGGGTITSSPAGINCGTSCSAAFSVGTTVNLTATPASGASFVGWSGLDVVSGSSGSIIMNANKSVSASFSFPLTVTKAGTGIGAVASDVPGIDCGSSCIANYLTGTTVTLSATPATGSVFTGWTGACTGTGSCIVTMDNIRNVSATFDLCASTVYYVDADGDGYGTGSGSSLCSNPGAGYATQAGDCDDGNSAVNPGATEVCNGIDDDCNGQIDEGVTIFVYEDKDQDGFGTGPLKQICPGTLGYSPITGDCDDNNASINPGVNEICNGIDDNCDGQIDEGCGNTTIDYVNLQFPENANILQGGTITAYAQVYVGGLTDATSGQAAGITAWIGYSTVNENPNSASFTWVPASFNTEVGNNDEYQATFGASLPAGTYYYASRFQRNGGAFYYGGYPFGSWNGTTSNSGVLTITAPPTNIDYVNLQFPAAATIAQGGSITAYAKIYVGGLTDVTAGQAGGISAWIGYSTVNENPNSTSFTWVPATFNVEIGNDDEYQATFGADLPAGIYYFASRFQRNGGSYSYGGYSSGGGNFWNGTEFVSGVLTINLSHSCGATGVHNPALTYGSVTDFEGNVYKTIQIGNQTWMAENLKTTKYRNGVSIPNITDNTLWQNNTTGAYCSYDNDEANDCPHGKLYNWYAATNNNQLCPTGWHVPKVDEWKTLEIYLGGFQAAGGKLKSTGTQYWQSPNTGATNETGFSMLPGGVRLNYGVFSSKGLYGYGWSSSENPLYNTGWMRFITYFNNNFDWSNVSKAYGMAVRCLKDIDTDLDGVNDNDDCDPADPTKWQTGDFYVDADGDGYGTGSLMSVCYGTTAIGYSTQNGDCDDNNSSVNPGATEQCNGFDDNCNGQVDEGFTDTDADGSADCMDADDDNDGTNDGSDCAPLDATQWQSANLFIDADGDGYTNGQQVICYGAIIPAGYITTSSGTDCNDNDASVQTPPAAVSPITGSDIICYGQTITLSTLSTGGTWSSSNPAVASIDQSGVVTGNTAGTVTIQYLLTNSCGSSSASYSVTVNPQITLSTSVTNVTCPGGNNGAINLTVSGGTPTTVVAPVTVIQDFNTLVNSGSSTSLPSGWFLLETGTGANTSYTGGTGSGSTGDTYSFGSSNSSERALGGLLSGSVVSTFGASFTNSTGATVTTLAISYTGEQWRLGAVSRTDRLDFQYSLNATSLSTGTWIDLNSLDFTAPQTTGSAGALDGNNAANRTALSSTITGLNIPNGASFWIRWNDFNATGSDDGLGVDDFSITMSDGSTATPYTYLWSNGATTEDISSLSATDYSVTVTDLKGCTANTSSSVIQQDLVAPVVLTKNITVNLDASGAASITPADIDNGSTDNCGTPNLLSVSPSVFNCSDISSAPITDLFISEYVEGSSNNKAVEIYNGTNAAINLSQYQIKIYINGSSTAGTTINLAGTLNAGKTYVLANSSSTASLLSLANQTSGSLSYNGDDAVALEKLSGAKVDVIGKIGEDPGTEWGTGLISTADNTIRRKQSIRNGDVNGSDAFAPSLEWDGFAEDDFSGLGKHVANGIDKLVTLTISDASGNISTATAIVTVVDATNPTITAPATVNTVADNGSCAATGVNLGTPTTADNCGVASATNDAPASFPVGTTIVTWTVTDIHGNTATATQDVVVTDNQLPVITCPANITTSTDAGACTKAITINPATATDNCGIAVNGITGVRSDGLALNAPYPFGTTTIAWTAIDVNGNQATCNQSITVSQVTTVTSVTVTPGTQQYSDRISFTATVTPNGCPVAGDVGGSVTFRIGTQVMGTAPVVGGIASLSNISLLEPLPSGTLPVGQMMPGVKNVTATIVGTDADYLVNNAASTLTITKENAIADYTGQEFASTGSATATTAPVRLSATVRDITAVDPLVDAHSGVIRNAKARFIIRTLNPTNMSVSSTSRTRWLSVNLLGTDTRIGSILLDTVFNIGSNNSLPYEIAVEVDSFYTSSTGSIASLVVSKTVNDFVTFGGNILMNPNTSSGLYPSNTGSRLNFGGQAKWNKNGTNLQGGVNMIWRSGTMVYQVKGIVGGSNGSLSVNASISSNRRATIVAKANVFDTETGMTVPNTSGSTITINLRDRGEPGRTDSIAIEVRNGAGQLIYSSNWTGIRTNERTLSGGNIQISGSNISTPAVRKAGDEDIASTPLGNKQLFDLKVYANPTLHGFGLQPLSSDKQSRIVLRITDVNGRIMAVYDQLKDGQNLRIGDDYVQGVYFAELIQGDQRRVVRLIKLK